MGNRAFIGNITAFSDCCELRNSMGVYGQFMTNFKACSGVKRVFE